MTDPTAADSYFRKGELKSKSILKIFDKYSYYSDAIENFEKAKNIYIANKNYERANECFKRIIECGTNLGKDYDYELNNVYEQYANFLNVCLKNNDEAIKYYNILLENNVLSGQMKKNNKIYHTLSNIYLSKSDDNLAIQQLLSAKDIELSESLKTQYGKTCKELFEIYVRLEKYKEAFDIYTELLEELAKSNEMVYTLITKETMHYNIMVKLILDDIDETKNLVLKYTDMQPSLDYDPNNDFLMKIIDSLKPFDVTKFTDNLTSFEQVKQLSKLQIILLNKIRKKYEGSDSKLIGGIDSLA